VAVVLEDTPNFYLENFLGDAAAKGSASVLNTKMRAAECSRTYVRCGSPGHWAILKADLRMLPRRDEGMDVGDEG